MNSDMDYIENNIKQEPEATFILILPPAGPEISSLVPVNEIKVEENFAEISVKLMKFDHGRKIKKKLFQAYRKCEKCDLVVTDRGFKKHSVKCMGGRKLECDFCGRLYGAKGNLNCHMKSHVKDYSFFCGKCGKGFKRRCELVKHQKHNNRSFRCLLCDKKFECKILKIQHMKEVHKKDLNCPKCHFTANDYKQLRNHHYNVHKMHHSCETCSKKFRSPSTLKEHQLQHKHGIYKNTSITFDCNQCTKSFLSSKYLKMHQKKCHGKEKFHCDCCSKILISRPQLFSHMQNHVKVLCQICKNIVSKKHFKRHLQTHS